MSTLQEILILALLFFWLIRTQMQTSTRCLTWWSKLHQHRRNFLIACSRNKVVQNSSILFAPDYRHQKLPPNFQCHTVWRGCVLNAIVLYLSESHVSQQLDNRKLSFYLKWAWPIHQQTSWGFFPSSLTSIIQPCPSTSLSWNKSTKIRSPTNSLVQNP